jgi:exonuclease SbcD
MRAAIIADSHFDEESRFAECIRLHEEIEEWVRHEHPDLVCHAGDIFEGTSTPREREAVAGWLQDIAQTCPVVIVRGNHDKALDIDYLSRLSSVYPIHAVERPRLISVAGFEVACLPWPKKAHLLASLGDVSQETAGAVAQEALRGVLRGIGSEMSRDFPRLFLGHVMVRGSVTSHGQPLVGMDMELGLDDLALVQADAYALGHIHMSQQWEIGCATVVYPGSPRRTAFGEVEQKGFTVLEFSDWMGRWGCRASAHVLAATPMLLLEAHWYPETYGVTGVREAGFTDEDIRECEPKGAEIRFRYHVSSEHQEVAKAEAGRLRDLWLGFGAVSVKLEPVVIAEARARAPEVSTATTLEEQLRAYWGSVGYDPGNREPSLLSKLATLEGGAL